MPTPPGRVRSCIELDSPPLRPLREHTAAVADLLRDAGPSAPYGEVCSWLDLTAGLETVEINTVAFAPWTPLCGRADEWQDARSSGLSGIHAELTRTLYAWNVYENAARVDRALARREKAGDKDVLAALGTVWQERKLPAHFLCAISGLREIVSNTPALGDLGLHLNPSEDYPLPALGARAAGKLRHLLAHGDIANPDPGEEATIANVTRAAEVGTRLLLLTVQMLLVTQVEGRQFMVSELDDDDYERPVLMEDALIVLHLATGQRYRKAAL